MDRSDRIKYLQETEIVLQQMLDAEQTGVPIENCFNAVIHACANVGDMQRAEKWLERISAARITIYEGTYNKIIAMRTMMTCFVQNTGCGICLRLDLGLRLSLIHI